MQTIEEIKAATAALPPDDQFELFRWWVGTGVFRAKQVAALKADIAAGVGDLEAGRFREYDQAGLAHLAEEICRTGRERLVSADKAGQ